MLQRKRKAAPSPSSSSCPAMLHLIRQALIMSFSVLVNAQSEDSKLTERAYVVLQKQDLVLLVLMIIMAVCVYKPISRRPEPGGDNRCTDQLSPGAPSSWAPVPRWAPPPRDGSRPEGEAELCSHRYQETPISDSCKIIASSSSSCFLSRSSSSWARAESSMARRSSESALEAEGELTGLGVSPNSTSTPSGILLEQQEKVLARVSSEDCSDLARNHARLQETLMDGVLQQLLVVVGHGCVSSSSSAVVGGGNVKH
ncbi:hypothetical protein F7725_012626 [Dissostichus mawsoni]|uniref:Uncharacterized protein n=1 Tax=Dissostichus mawsoni TaxID=36200 RepID=A0A7J5YMT5_DISMA|nr:hypothetical protein F7725_012626 [Dissostichus mawsoni]